MIKNILLFFVIKSFNKFSIQTLNFSATVSLAWFSINKRVSSV